MTNRRYTRRIHTATHNEPLRLHLQDVQGVAPPRQHGLLWEQTQEVGKDRSIHYCCRKERAMCLLRFPMPCSACAYSAQPSQTNPWHLPTPSTLVLLAVLSSLASNVMIASGCRPPPHGLYPTGPTGNNTADTTSIPRAMKHTRTTTRIHPRAYLLSLPHRCCLLACLGHTHTKVHIRRLAVSSQEAIRKEEEEGGVGFKFKDERTAAQHAPHVSMGLLPRGRGHGGR